MAPTTLTRMAPRALIAMTRMLRLWEKPRDDNDKMGGVRAKGTPNRTIRISDEIWDDASELAERLGESVADVVRESLVGYVELHNEPTWAAAMATAKERGDYLPDIILDALNEYIYRDD